MLFSELFVTLPTNIRGRDFLVGDLHGQGALLDRGLELVSFNPAIDRLVAIGDLIDRGPDSARLLRQVQSEDWFIAVRGNHELLMQEAMASFEAHQVWKNNGNDWSRMLDSDALESLSTIITGFPICIELPLPDGRRIGLIHAEVRVGQSWDDLRSLVVRHYDGLDDSGGSNASAALWGRRRIRAWAAYMLAQSAQQLDAIQRARVWESLEPVPGIDLIVAGHSVLTQKIPAAIGNLLWIETGAYLDDGRLTLVDIQHNQYWQVGHAKEGGGALDRHPKALPTPVMLDESWRPTPEALRNAQEQERDRLNKLLWWM